MAQAARLSLRMHKELKLLLSDPPHGASLPHLSSGHFSTIDALIEGPEDTVYAHGIFDVKIQIPERYPFQPPIVAFATPIYHPNIDTSGRICLDILNLPPKGAWQPSLNISTVLMSIRLLLSEPNPDDGLMCEVSREYKYNRQTFDFKAREMTDKYAKVKSDGSSTSLHIHKSPNRCEVKSHGDERGNSVIAGNHEKLKLTMESSLTISPTETCDNLAKDMPNCHLLLSNTVDGNGKRKEMIGFCEANTSGNKSSRKKLSLGLPPKSQKEDLCGEELTDGVAAVCKENKKPHLNGKKLSLGPKQPLDHATSLTNNLASSLQTSAAKSDNNRLCRKLSLRPFGESQLNEISKNKGLAKTDIEPEMNQNQDARSWWGEFENSGMEEAVIPGPFVVLDSDESGEDEEREYHICRSSRSRSSLTRRGLKRKP